MVAQQGDDLVAVEVVRFGERDAELGGVVDAGEFAAHPFGHGGAAGIRHRVCGALRAVAVAVDAHLGEQAGPFEAGDRVVHRAVRDRDEAIVVADPHQPDHLVGMHVALAEQREHHHPRGVRRSTASCMVTPS